MIWFLLGALVICILGIIVMALIISDQRKEIDHLSKVINGWWEFGTSLEDEDD